MRIVGATVNPEAVVKAASRVSAWVATSVGYALTADISVIPVSNGAVDPG